MEETPEPRGHGSHPRHACEAAVLLVVERGGLPAAAAAAAAAPAAAAAAAAAEVLPRTPRLKPQHRKRKANASVQADSVTGVHTSHMRRLCLRQSAANDWN